VSAFTVIRLDTTPPVITWGPVTDAIGSETMTVEYLLDEQEMVKAELRLVDNRTLQGVIAPDRVTVDLPDDAPEGDALFTVTLRDDVGNETTETQYIHITGVLVPLPPPIPVLDGPPVEEPWRTRSRCVTRSRYRILVTSRLPSRATIRSRTRVARRPALSSPSSAVVRSTVRVRAHVSARSELQSRATWTITKRPEGPEHEAEIVFLLL
jgi:hypothetical protein